MPSSLPRRRGGRKMRIAPIWRRHSSARPGGAAGISARGGREEALAVLAYDLAEDRSPVRRRIDKPDARYQRM
jgi:hypothetical protein